MPKPVVWGGFEFGASPDTILGKLPSAWQREDRVELALDSFGAEFDVVFEFDKLGLSGVKIGLVRILSTTFDRLRSSLVHQISLNHGRGGRKHQFGNEYRKRWVDGDVIVNLLAVDDPSFPFSQSNIQNQSC